MKKITPFLWFDNKAEEAARFYVSLFKNSRIINVNPMMVIFELDGQELYALNGGPQFKFTEAMSLFVKCESQEEIDMLWEKLSEGGEKGNCGWLKDRYGLSWQIVPTILEKLMGENNAEKSHRVMHAMMQMKKFDIQKLKDAADNG